jgi:hypothetical protein
VNGWCEDPFGPVVQTYVESIKETAKKAIADFKSETPLDGNDVD